MYENIGGKIKGLAGLIGILLLLVSIVVLGFFYSNNTKADNIFGWIALLAGVIGYLFTWPIYGFGQLVEDTQKIKQHLAKQTTSVVKPSSTTWVCPRCNTKNDITGNFCEQCGMPNSR